MLIPEDRQDEEPNILLRLRRGERVDHFETIRRRKDGTLLDLSLTISPVKDLHGKIIGASKIARDISERKRADEAVRSLNAQLSDDLAAMTRMQELSTRLIQAGTFSGFSERNSRCRDRHHRSRYGQHPTPVPEGSCESPCSAVSKHPFSSSSIRFMMASPLAARPSTVESASLSTMLPPVRSFQGTPALAAMMAAEARAVQSTPLLSRSGHVLGIFSTHYRIPRRPSERDLRLLDILARLAADLIERKRTEQVRAQLSAIVESSGDAIYIYDFDGKLLTWNRAAEEFYGYSEHEILGRNVGAIVPPGQMAELVRPHRSRNYEGAQNHQESGNHPDAAGRQLFSPPS